jgi:hypothetical protein
MQLWKLPVQLNMGKDMKYRLLNRETGLTYLTESNQ